MILCAGCQTLSSLGHHWKEEIGTSDVRFVRIERQTSLWVSILHQSCEANWKSLDMSEYLEWLEINSSQNLRVRLRHCAHITFVINTLLLGSFKTQF